MTGAVQARANAILENEMRDVKRLSLEDAMGLLEEFDFITPYVRQLPEVIDIDAIKQTGVHVGIDPLGGASLPVWEAIVAEYGLNFEIVNKTVDPRFAFMSVDKDGKIRMDCSSPYAMAGLLRLKDDFDVAVGNDPDADRHGIVTADGLMNPNHYLAVMIDYLFQHRPGWRATAGVGKTLVSSALIDRVAAGIGRPLVEVPVGFKYFVEGLLTGDLGFGGEESAGASFLRLNGGAWSTDKDGLIPGLLAAEMTAKTGKTPSQRFAELTGKYGATAYDRQTRPPRRSRRRFWATSRPTT